MNVPNWARRAPQRETFDARSPAPPLTIRLAGPGDVQALQRLAAMDSSSPPTGDVLLAEVDGRLWAARSLDDGHAVADPFQPTGELAWLLGEHARRQRRAAQPRLNRRLRPVAS